MAGNEEFSDDNARLNREDNRDIIIDSLMSLNGAIFSKTFTAPLTRIQNIYQCYPEMVIANRLDPPYKGIYDCIKTIWIQEGPYSLYRGNAIDIASHLPNFLLQYSIKNILRGYINISPNETKSMQAIKGIFVGGLAGSLVLSLTYSMDLVHTRLCNDIMHVKNEEIIRQFWGIKDCYYNVFKMDGIRGLYRGYFVACTGIFIHRGILFGLYDTINNNINSYKQSFMFSFMIGYSSTIIANVLSYPFMTIQRRMIMRSMESIKYKNSIDCVKYILKHENIFALYRGVSLHVFNGFIGGCALTGFDILNNVYAQYRFAKN